MKILAHYLPQFHPTPENDQWWGKGFTEWTNVGRAKPLFKGHDQPKVPADLGYYDLRLESVRIQQAELAMEAGVDGFCYWHYWFGNGRQLLQMPFNEVLRTGKPEFPFCLGWANHSWYNKTWSETKWYSKDLLIEQTYPGLEDIDAHFYSVLPAFKDTRYFRINDKPLFLIYDAPGIPDVDLFITRWNELAVQNTLVGIFFVAQADNVSEVNSLEKYKFDAINLSLHNVPFGGRKTSFLARLKRYAKTLLYKMPNIVDYADAIHSFYDPIMNKKNIFPTLIPNFDHTPRSGIFGKLYSNSTPEKFAEHAKIILQHIKHKDPDYQIIFLKSWNEWGEGNYMEPDIKWGKAYIKALADEKAKM
ncbi:MAG: glycoside hydrolase family 99-like domain-containing protein [Chlorobium sp.]|nr:glycoside hydrolase family 99-like domain-containing protein [Chlorobium sp.]